MLEGEAISELSAATEEKKKLKRCAIISMVGEFSLSARAIVAFGAKRGSGNWLRERPRGLHAYGIRFLIFVHFDWSLPRRDSN